MVPMTVLKAGVIATSKRSLRKAIGDPPPSFQLLGAIQVLFLLITSQEFLIHCQTHLREQVYSLSFRKMPHQMN